MHRVLVALLCATVVTAGAQSMSRDEFKAHQVRIAAEHDTARARCKPLEGNERDLCKARADGARRIARAELDAQHKPGPKSAEAVVMARAETEHALAAQRCDALKGNPREVCRKDAKAAFAAAKAQAKRAAATTRAPAPADLAAARAKDATQKRRDAALFAAGRERCDAMQPALRDGCLADLRARTGQAGG
jgi:hypothetical protein